VEALLAKFITTEIIDQIKSLTSQEKSIKDISELLGYDNKLISKWCKKYNIEGIPSKKKGFAVCNNKFYQNRQKTPKKEIIDLDDEYKEMKKACGKAYADSWLNEMKKENERICT
jgi:transposase